MPDILWALSGRDIPPAWSSVLLARGAMKVAGQEGSEDAFESSSAVTGDRLK